MKLIIDIDENNYKLCKSLAPLTKEYISTVIGNGIPFSNEGDLISREALIEAITSETKNEFEFICLSRLFEIIDNAPTVEYPFYQEAYQTGYEEGKNERPQGEWENDSDNLPICNKCGEIALQRIFVKMPHLIQDVRMVRSNYCPNCGAKMQK